MDSRFPGTPVAEVRSVAENETTLALKNVALKALERAKEIKDQKKLLAEQKKAVLENDADYAQAKDEIKELEEAVKEATEAVKQRAEYANLEAKGKELNEELKDLAETINGHLFEYSRQTGKNEITDNNGKVLKIKHQVQVKSGQMRLF